MSKFVFDASALLILLYDEPGKDDVAANIEGAAMSTVNLAEVAGKLSDSGLPEDEVKDAVSGLGLEIHAFEADDAIAVATLRQTTREAGLSLGDRACLALAATLGWPVLTADRAWTSLKLGITVRLVR